MQLNPDDDKYTLDKKFTNKSGYPKVIMFDGLEGMYSDTHSIRDNYSSYRQNRDEEKEEVPDEKLNFINNSKQEDVESDFTKEKKKNKQKEINKSIKIDDKKENKKELVSIDEDELNNQPQENNILENIIDPDGKKEEWKLENDDN